MLDKIGYQRFLVKVSPRPACGLVKWDYRVISLRGEGGYKLIISSRSSYRNANWPIETGI